MNDTNEQNEINASKQGPALRLDYFLSLGLKPYLGDSFSCRGSLHVVDALNIGVISSSDALHCERFITSLAPRENTGAQPCGDNVPVVVEWGDGLNEVDAAVNVLWNTDGFRNDIDSWSPDLAELIKMQDEHDAKRKRARGWVLGASVKPSMSHDDVESIMAVVETQSEPQINETKRIEFKCEVGGLDVIEFTLKFKTDEELVGVDKDGCAMIIKKESFIRWWPLESEMDLAKKGQITKLCKALNIHDKSTKRYKLLVKLQEMGELKEIKL